MCGAYPLVRLEESDRNDRFQTGFFNLPEPAAARTAYGVRAGDAIAVERAEAPPLHATPEAIPLAVLYEDADVVAIDKPAGMVVHAGAGVHSGTLVNALLHRFAELSGLAGALRPGIVHRLDRFPRGVLTVADIEAAHPWVAA